MKNIRLAQLGLNTAAEQMSQDNFHPIDHALITGWIGATQQLLAVIVGHIKNAEEER